MSVTKEQLDEIIKRHERVFSVSAAEAYRQVEAASKTFSCEAAQHIADRAGEIGAAADESSRSPIPAWDQAVNEHVVENRIRLPITTTCESCGELCLWCWWTGAIPSCGCIEDEELERKQAEFEAQHGGAVAEGEPKGQYEQAYSLLEEGWTIPSVGEGSRHLFRHGGENQRPPTSRLGGRAARPGDLALGAGSAWRYAHGTAITAMPNERQTVRSASASWTRRDRDVSQQGRSALRRHAGAGCEPGGMTWIWT